MTFNTNSRGGAKIYAYNNNNLNSSLITSDDEVSKEVNNLNSLVFDFEKNFEEVKDYHRNLSSMSEKEFARRKVNIHNKIDDLPGLIQGIQSSIIKLENINAQDPSIRMKVSETMKTINNRVKPKQQELSRIVYEITEKEKARSDFTQIPISDQEMERFQSLDNKEKSDSNLMIKDVQFNDQVLNARETELLHIQKVSSQIKEMTSYMNEAVQEQGKVLGKLYLFMKYVLLNI